MLRSKLSTVFAVTTVVLAPLACAPDASVTAPSASSVQQGPHFSLAGDALKAAADSTKEADKRAFEALSSQWRAYKDSVHTGLLAVNFARCEPLPTAGETKRVGPKGGTITMGKHKLLIPAGALAAEVAITGTAPAGSLREVQFAPHGLKFLKPVRLTMSVDKCILPDAATAEIVYTAVTGIVVEREPSNHDKVTKLVEGWTDHFSGYVVAYGRR